jgi:hypothetical protein
LPTQEQFGTEGDRVSLVHRSLRYEKSEQRKMKEVQEEPELRHGLENLTRVLGAIEDVRGGEQSLEEQVAQQCEYVADQGKEAMTEKAREERTDPSKISELRDAIGIAKAAAD